ncbi:MAG: hypothetical protein CMN30_22065 [Sandaracinus sp.]|nr:hypothetical protein [Sandaracinus sp.]
MARPREPRAAHRHLGARAHVKVWKEGDPLFELRGPHGDEPARVRIAVTQTVATRGMPNECPLTFRGVRGVDPLPVGGGEGSGTDDGGFRYVNNYWLDATHLEALASVRRLRLRNCLGDIPLGDDTRAALGAMTERLEVLERTAGPEWGRWPKGDVGECVVRMRRPWTSYR